MDFLKSVLNKASSGFNGYNQLEKIDLPSSSIFTLHNAIKRDDGTKCSILMFEAARQPSLLPLARNYLTKLKTIRHPGIVKFVDSYETDGLIYIATERIEPLHFTLNTRPDTEIITWGLYSVATTMRFINSEITAIHGNLRTSSVFTSESGEWKVAGFEVLSSMKDDDPLILRYGSGVPDLGPHMPPEIQSKGFDVLREAPVGALDAFLFANLISESFNGISVAGTTPSLMAQGKIPAKMWTQYKRLLLPSPSSRLSIATFVEFGRRPGSFFHSDVIESDDFIQSITLRSKVEIEDFVQNRMKDLAALPTGYTKAKVLPEMIKSFEFGGGGAVVLSTILTIGAELHSDDFEDMVTPMLLRTWNSSDRSVRLILLETIPMYVARMSPKLLNDRIFPALGTAFTDPAPIMRESAIKSVLHLMPYLSPRNINNELLKYLSKTQNDPQPGIRTNTTICLGKIAPSLGHQTRQKVLLAAFSRSLKDPFVHARIASLQALHATIEVFQRDDIATRLLPSICALLVDPERPVREQAKRACSAFLDALYKQMEDIPDAPVSVVPSFQGGSQTATSEKGGGMSEVAGVWAGWAVSTLSRNLVEKPGLDRANSVPVLSGTHTAQQRPYSTSTGEVNVPTLSTSDLYSGKSSTNGMPGTGLVLSKKKTETAFDQMLSSTSREAVNKSNEDAWDGDEWGNDGSAFDEETPSETPPFQTNRVPAKSNTKIGNNNRTKSKLAANIAEDDGDDAWGDGWDDAI